MKRALSWLWAVLSSRALSPVVLGFFFLLYVGIAFFTDEALTLLIALTGKNLLLAAVLGLIPLNCFCRLVREAGDYLKRRRTLSGASVLQPPLYDEQVELASSALPKALLERLESLGYRTAGAGDRISAWLGLSLSPVRILFLAGAFCLFAGIVTSLVGRTVTREQLIEGISFQAPSGEGAVVNGIVYRNAAGPILARELLIETSELGQGGGVRQFGIYPPALFGGAFVYPRYLGVALGYRFSAPDFPAGYENKDVFPLYPPGKEATLPVPGSPYKVVISLARPEDGSDPYMTGRMLFFFKLLKGSDLVVSGSLPGGGEFSKDGIRFSLPDARRMVITDFVADRGVQLIWCAGLLFALAAAFWLPVRWLLPRREMVFSFADGRVQACSHAEGRVRKHAGVFHETLDYLAGAQAGVSLPVD